MPLLCLWVSLCLFSFLHALQNCLAGRFWPLDRMFNTPDLCWPVLFNQEKTRVLGDISAFKLQLGSESMNAVNLLRSDRWAGTSAGPKNWKKSIKKYTEIYFLCLMALKNCRWIQEREAEESGLCSFRIFDVFCIEEVVLFIMKCKTNPAEERMYRPE